MVINSQFEIIHVIIVIWCFFAESPTVSSCLFAGHLPSLKLT